MSSFAQFAVAQAHASWPTWNMNMQRLQQHTGRFFDSASRTRNANAQGLRSLWDVRLSWYHWKRSNFSTHLHPWNLADLTAPHMNTSEEIMDRNSKNLQPIFCRCLAISFPSLVPMQIGWYKTPERFQEYYSVRSLRISMIGPCCSTSK